MNDKKPKLPTATSPRGVLAYPWLNKPDFKFDTAGKYKTSLVLDAAGSGVAKFKTLVDELAQAEFDKAKAALIKKGNGKAAKELKLHLPYIELCDGEGEPTGQIKFSFASKASYVRKNKDGSEETVSLKPALFDGKGKPMNALVYGGSEAKIATQLFAFYNAADGKAGVSLRINAVQVIVLRTAGEKDASAFGFEEEEDGYDGSASGNSHGFTDESEDDDAAEGQTSGGDGLGEDDDDF